MNKSFLFKIFLFLFSISLFFIFYNSSDINAFGSTNLDNVLNSIKIRNNNLKNWHSTFNSLYEIKSSENNNFIEIYTKGEIFQTGTSKRRINEHCNNVPEFNRIIILEENSYQVFFPDLLKMKQDKNYYLLKTKEWFNKSDKVEYLKIDKFNNSILHILKFNFETDDNNKFYMKVWVNKEKGVIEKIEVYKNGSIFTTSIMSNFKNINDLWLATKVTQTFFENGKTVLKTTMTLNDIKVNTGISDSLYKIDKLSSYEKTE